MRQRALSVSPRTKRSPCLPRAFPLSLARPAFVRAHSRRQMRRKGWAALVLLLLGVGLSEGSRGRCDYGNIDRRGGRWVIPQKCTHLYLSQNGFAVAGSRQMGEALRNNTFVTEVDSSSCNVQTGAKHFETMLAENTALRRLNLGNNRIDDTGTEAISRGLAVNKGLKGLYLPNNRIGGAGAAALADALKTNTVLETLNLDSNRLGDEGAISLAAGLAANRGLRSLVLGGNDIGNEGAAALAAAVASHPTLQLLQVRFNRIKGEGNRLLAEAVMGKQGFTFLGPKPAEEAVERHRLKEAVLRGQDPAEILKVAEVYMQGKMSTLDLIDRYSQAHCWYTLAQKAGDAKVAAAAGKRIAALLAKRAPWPLSLLLPPLCNEDCLADSEDVCKAPLRERESLLVHPDDIRRKRRRLRRHRSHDHHPHDEF